ncbi:MAG: Rieske (2Fe-2S) protein [Solirubrobacterales bacterium]|nr:Rieske (2Fe-2S) protein [Solirubrobacterales bacterium]
MIATATVSQPLETLVDRAAGAAVLDAPAKPLGKAMRGAGPGAVKDLLSGTWMGHALHPLLTDVVIGCWASASILDLLGGSDSDEAAQRLIAAGIAAYPVTALTGISDWADSEAVDDEVRRVGLVHAAFNSVALACYIASLKSRRNGRHGRGVALALAGAGAMGVGGFLGGHLAFRLGIGVDQTLFDRGPGEWTEALHADALGPDKPIAVQVGETPVMLVRDGDDVLALHDRCSHRGCSLSTGEVEDGAIVCPCHGSRFDLRSGEVLRGPATAPQPVLETRTQAGRIEVRAVSTEPGPG